MYCSLCRLPKVHSSMYTGWWYCPWCLEWTCTIKGKEIVKT